MLKFFKRKKPETEEERFIRYADTIASNSDYNGELNKECLDIFAELGRMNPPELLPELLLIRNEIITLQPKNNDGITVDLEITKRYCQNNYDIVKNHLLNNGYINKPDHAQKWILNERGKDMKRLKGHKRYEEYLAKKLKAELSEINGKIYWKRRTIFSATLGLILGILISWIAIKLKLPTPLRPSPEETQLSTPAKQS